MEDQGETEAKSTRHGASSSSSERSEPVRSRWTPKPEQILILESIFNSGMVNPPKDETVRIRKLLQKYGSVGDANVFYWFQNRRSRSRRRQRQIQAGLLTNTAQTSIPPQASAAVVSAFDHYNTCFSPPSVGSSSSASTVGGVGVASDDLFSFSHQMGLPDIDQSSILCPDISNLNYQPSGSMTVFINGIATDVPRGPFDIRALFGQDVMLVHSSGVPVPVNNYGALLQMGESYFLVSVSS